MQQSGLPRADLGAVHERDVVVVDAPEREREPLCARQLGAKRIEAVATSAVRTFVTPGSCGIPGDLNGDGTVNAADLAEMLNGWGSAGPTDLNGDGFTDLIVQSRAGQLHVVISGQGPSINIAQSIAIPASVSDIALGDFSRDRPLPIVAVDEPISDEVRLAIVNWAAPAQGPLTVRLAVRQPFAGAELLAFLAARAVPGVEHVEANSYSRSMRLAHGAATVRVEVGSIGCTCTVSLQSLADLQSAVQRTRRLLDLDADPVLVDAHLADDPLLAPLVAARPGLRAPGHPDGTELLVRAVLGQQVSVAGARTLAARLVAAHGEPLTQPEGGVTHLFPTAATIAGLEPSAFAMPRARATALADACRLVADGSLVLDAGSDRSQASAALQAVRGIGPWTAGYVSMRALGDPDVFLPTDIGVRNALVALGQQGDPRSAAARAERWRPWRSYALHHLWASL